MVYTPQLKAQCVEWFIEEGKSMSLFETRYRRENGRNAVPPDKKLLWNWYNHFKEVGLGSKKKTGNQWVRTKQTVANVVNLFNSNPHTSTRHAASIQGMPSRRSVQRILDDEMFHPYKLQLRHQLKIFDINKRIDHAIAMLDLIEHSDFLNSVLFSDEAHFYQHGLVNKHNFRYWAQENPHFYREEPLHSPRWTVWAAIGRPGIVGPFFFEQNENINQHNYLSMLQQHFLPIVQDWSSFNDIIFMQDGAPAHYAMQVRNWLDENFPLRWMGRGTTNEPAPFPWPPNSPDLTPMDFFLWGWLKNRIYSTPVENMADLRARIEQAFIDLPQEMVKFYSNKSFLPKSCQ